MKNTTCIMHNVKGRALILMVLTLILGWLFVFCAPGVVEAATYYVDKNHSAASDSNPGTEVRPFLHIQNAVNLAQPGDTVLIKGSPDIVPFEDIAELTDASKTMVFVKEENDPRAIYNVSGINGITCPRPGTQGAPITIAAYPGHTVMIKGNGTNYGISLDNGSYHVFRGIIFKNFNKATESWGPNNDIVIENCIFTVTFETGLRLRNVTNLTMRECLVYRCFEAGVSVKNGRNITFERVESSYNDDGQGTSGDGDGFCTDPSENINFIGCIARNNSEDGFDLTVNGKMINCIASGQGACNVKLWRRDADNFAEKTVTIINSLIYNAGEAGIKVSQGARLNLYNSVIYGNGEEGVAFRGISITQGPSTVTSKVIDSILANNGHTQTAGGIEVLQGSINRNEVIADHNFYFNNGRNNIGLASDTNSITGQDPLFFGAPNGNFHLRSSSPAINAGIIVPLEVSNAFPEVNKDFDGRSRTSDVAPDIGAYEKVPGNQAPVFTGPAQTNFTIDEGKELSIEDISAVDPEGNEPVFFIDSGDIVKEMSIDQNTGRFTFTPSFEEGGDNRDPSKVYNIRLGVTDNLYSDPPTYCDITITVHNVNRPSIYAGPIKFSLIENQPFMINLDVKDPDVGDLVAVGLSDLPGNATLENGRISWFPAQDQVGINYKSYLTLNDGLETTGPIEIDFAVLPKAPYVEPDGPVFYVNGETGNDNNDGRHPDNAWKTIGKAASTVTAGKVLIKGRDYYEWTSITHSGTPEAPIVFMPDPNSNGRKVVMHGKNPDGTSVKSDGSPEAINFYGSCVVIDGLEFEDFAETLYFRGNNNVIRILNCAFSDDDYGVYGSGNDVRIENCQFNNIYDRAIYVSGNNIYISNVKIDKAADRGINIYGGRGQNINIMNSEISNSGVGIRTTAEVNIMNCKIHDNGAGIEPYLDESNIAASREIYVYNSEIYYNNYGLDIWYKAKVINSLVCHNRYGFAFPHEENPRAATIYNSVVANTSQFSYLTNVTLTEDYNIFGAGFMPRGAKSFTADPLFVNAPVFMRYLIYLSGQFTGTVGQENGKTTLTGAIDFEALGVIPTDRLDILNYYSNGGSEDFVVESVAGNKITLTTLAGIATPTVNFIVYYYPLTYNEMYLSDITGMEAGKYIEYANDGVPRIIEGIDSAHKKLTVSPVLAQRVRPLYIGYWKDSSIVNEDFRLKYNPPTEVSPGIDAGIDVSDLGHIAIPLDINGRSRPWDGNGDGTAQYDIGAYEYMPSVVGDVNGDGVVNALDVQACVNHILATQDWSTRADVNKDSAVNALDVQVIVNIILGV